MPIRQAHNANYQFKWPIHGSLHRQAIEHGHGMALWQACLQDGVRVRHFLRLFDNRLFIISTRQAQACLFFLPALFLPSPHLKLRDFARYCAIPLHVLPLSSPAPLQNPDPATTHTWNSGSSLVYLWAVSRNQVLQILNNTSRKPKSPH